MTAEIHAAPLVSASWLHAHLGVPDRVVLDIRSTESGGRTAFEAAHIPGAVHSDYALDGWRVQDGGAGGLLPGPDHLSALLGRLGIAPGRRVVVVSAGLAPSDFSAAARVYWTLKTAGHAALSILDGGFAGWTGAGFPVETGASPPRAADPYPVRATEAPRARLADVAEALRAGGAALLDGRSPAQFRGEEKSPQAARAGRLPRAIHLDHAQAFDPGTGRLRPAEDLARLYGALPGGPVISYCNTGHLASTNWFVLSELLGRPETSLYDGSMSEWTQDPGRPVETGPDTAGRRSDERTQRLSGGP
jgi:thiosulfate/3-mercaptopyruvate sulfurtransferase